METILLPLAYFPPVSYLKFCAAAKSILLEGQEHFIKQTIRNRCTIYGANGKLNLVIPVRHEGLHERPICEVQIANDSNWKTIHWRSLESAYRRSAFFEYYEGEFRDLLLNPGENLFEFNLRLLRKIFLLFEIDVELNITSSWEKTTSSSILDLREHFNREKNLAADSTEYYQVFDSKFGFIPGLSILDLLFNEGPLARNYLTQ